VTSLDKAVKQAPVFSRDLYFDNHI